MLGQRDYLLETRDKSCVISLVFGFWLSGVFAVSLYSKANIQGSLSIILMAASVVWPLCYFLVSHWSFIPKKLTNFQYIALFLFVIFSGLSVLVSADPLRSFGYYFLTLAGFFLALLFNSNLNLEKFDLGIKIFTFLTFILLVAFSVYDYHPGLRLGEGMNLENPNAIAMVGVSVVLASIIFKNYIIRYAIMIGTLFIIFLTGSRASMVASFVGIFIAFYLRLSVKSVSNKILVLLLIILIFVIILSYSDFFIFQFDNFFALNSEHRGLQSGASGRFRAWVETWEHFLDSPIVGNGYRAHEQLSKISTSAHNGYLALLSEIGIFGFMGSVFLVFFGIFSLLKQFKNNNFLQTKPILVGLCFGYLFLAIFERYFFNFGNPTSLLFIIAIMQPKVYYLNNGIIK